MKHWKQVTFSLVLLVSVGVFVGIQLQDGSEAAAGDGMEGHNHAAMTGGDQQNPVRLSAEDSRRIGVTFAEVEMRTLDRSVESLGTVVYDETSLAAVNPKLEGWVETLHVDFTGAPVRAGQPLMSVYSPKLVSAQEELVLAAKLLREAGPGRAVDNAVALVESARRRLAYWDVPDEQIRRIEETGEVTRTLTFRAPASGVLVEKNVVEGDRIMPGMTVFRIADLSRVWVEAEIFEKDLGLVALGRPADAIFEAYPGQVFEAEVTYVYPTVSMETRTGRIRLELPNPDGVLKPGMYARIAVDVPPTGPTPVVPRSAVLSTGTRSLVFVQAADGSLVPREVTTGLSVDRHVQVLEGLSAGERVVSSAAFLVDAESNLGALTAGMDMESPEEMDHSQHQMADTAGMDMESPEEMDHSQHQMADTAGMDMESPEEMDHSQHQMGDTAGMDMESPEEMDHSQHQMQGGDAGAMDHSTHVMPPDTTISPLRR